MELFYYIKYTYPNNLNLNKYDESCTCSGNSALDNNMMFPVLPSIHKMNKQSVLLPCSVNINSGVFLPESSFVCVFLVLKNKIVHNFL